MESADLKALTTAATFSVADGDEALRLALLGTCREAALAITPPVKTYFWEQKPRSVKSCITPVIILYFRMFTGCKRTL